jgi:hypothetical protein
MLTGKAFRNLTVKLVPTDISMPIGATGTQKQREGASG